jgi:hypothetical protein
MHALMLRMLDNWLEVSVNARLRKTLATLRVVHKQQQILCAALDVSA